MGEKIEGFLPNNTKFIRENDIVYIDIYNDKI